MSMNTVSMKNALSVFLSIVVISCALFVALTPAQNAFGCTITTCTGSYVDPTCKVDQNTCTTGGATPTCADSGQEGVYPNCTTPTCAMFGLQGTYPNCQLPPTASLVPTNQNIYVDDSATLTWSSTNANSCTGVGFSTGGATSGTVSVSPSADTTYSVSCTQDAIAATGGGDGPTIGNEWWAGPQTKLFSEILHNNGQQGTLCSNAAAGSAWNESFVEYPNRCGDAGCGLIIVTCYAVSNPTGTVSKPYSAGLSESMEKQPRISQILHNL